jgi:hypothetical protein
MNPAQVYNYVEVGLRPAMGLVLAAYGLGRRGPARRDGLAAAAVLGAFGASDWFEADTDNEWWHPWWLLLWKAACGLALAWFAFAAWRRQAAAAARRRAGDAPPAAQPSPRAEPGEPGDRPTAS